MPDTKIVTSRTGEVLVERFNRARRVEHWLVMATFVALIVTGLPQRFDGSRFGHAVLDLLGGLDTARFVHRTAGIVFVLHAFAHLGAIVVGGITGRMRMTLLPVPQDLKDAWANLRFYLGYAKEPPKLPKFDYRQKFEYMGLVLGGLVMVFTGLALMYPVAVAGVLPAQVIPAAFVAHSNEAMLALSVLVVWHVYGSHLSPEVFPLDRTIFTGFITAEELKERHALEYERLFDEKKPKDAPTPAATPPGGPAAPERARREHGAAAART